MGNQVQQNRILNLFPNPSPRPARAEFTEKTQRKVFRGKTQRKVQTKDSEEQLIDRYFKLAENHTTIKQEMLGGITTFVTMAYIIVVNPQILAQAGMPPEGVVFATCVSAAAATLVMGLYANY